ncbi:hypothetical protein Tco_0762999 [Tanacetum coccineum]
MTNGISRLQLREDESGIGTHASTNRLDDFRDVNRVEAESEGSIIDSTESYSEEVENSWGVNQPDRDRHYWSVQVKKKLRDKFFPVQFRREAFTEYHNFKQSRVMLVEEFTSEFDHLRLCCDMVEEEEETIARYLAAPKPEITDVVHLQQYLS